MVWVVVYTFDNGKGYQITLRQARESAYAFAADLIREDLQADMDYIREDAEDNDMFKSLVEGIDEGNNEKIVDTFESMDGYAGSRVYVEAQDVQP